ncbi:MAG: calcium-binding protein [Gammaproteobacteria bacterium]|jgi:Ca2+-binding EF-hand superfamily protein
MKIAATLLTLYLAGNALAETPEPAAAGDAFMHHYDSNKDGKISLEEFQAPAAKQFEEMDLNADGSISADEATAFVEKLRSEMLETSKDQ